MLKMSCITIIAQPLLVWFVVVKSKEKQSLSPSNYVVFNYSLGIRNVPVCLSVRQLGEIVFVNVEIPTSLILHHPTS